MLYSYIYVTVLFELVMFILNKKKTKKKKQDLTLVFISYEIYETRRSSFPKFHMK